jgi:hypothetical protein
MVEDEEGTQVNSALSLLQHYWNYFLLLPMEIKANGCDVSAGGRQYEGLYLTRFLVQLDTRIHRLTVAYV